MKAIVLLSGGVDSSTCLGIAVDAHGPAAVSTITIEYGQRHRAELDHAARIAGHYGVGHETMSVPHVFGEGGSSLIQGGPDLPSTSYASLPEGKSPAYVPFRNGVLLSIATAVADTREADYVYFGAHREDGDRWAYPDCTPEFIGAMANAMFIGTYFKTRLITPLQWLRKAEVVALGTKIGVPYGLTLSCYAGQEPACGVCPTCRSRYEAFRINGLEDPVPYAAIPERDT